MLTRTHIEGYKKALVQATVNADFKIAEAFSHARMALCAGCDYCRIIRRHKQILDQTFTDLMTLVFALQPGMRPSQMFPKRMTHDAVLYRGFITDTGEYVPMEGMIDDSTYRKHYAEKHGLERAYRMINVHAGGASTRMLFCDRKYTPTESQYQTIKELMLDAQGALTFHFQLDTKHPRP